MISLRWKIGAMLALLVSLLTFGAAWHHIIYQQGIDSEVTKQAVRDAKAKATRIEEIREITDQQAATTAEIQKDHDEKIATVRAAVAVAPRLRLPAFCRAAPTPADTAGTQGSDAANPGAGLLPGRTDADLRALILVAEEAAATGRAAQEFIRANGMAK